MLITKRIQQLTTEGAFATLAAARRLEAQGRHIVHLEIGQPDFETPAHIVEAGVKALRDGRTRYEVPAGLPALRDAVAAYLGPRGIAASAENVVVTPGAKAALYMALVVLVEEGSEVLIPDPGFPAYDAVVRSLGATPVGYPLDAAQGFTVHAADLASRVTPRTRAIVLNSPHNPTGGSIAADDLAEIAQLAVQHDLTVITDEIYADLQYHEPFSSIQALPGMRQRTAIVDGLSKSHAMTGWRLGYVILPAAAAEHAATLAANSYSCAASFVQHAAVAALTGSQECVDAMRAEYAARAELVSQGLSAIPGVQCARPRGAFYAFPDVRGVLSRHGASSAAFAHELLHDYGVALLAGSAFGAGGEGFLRISYATSRDGLALALDRISQCVSDRSAVAA